jgi:hypothetical protein
MRSAFAIALASAVLLAESLFAADHLVGPVGSGAPYEKIQLAIDAAQPGDRVFVLPGTYFESISIGKPLELVGSGSQASFIRAIPAAFPGLVTQPMAATGVPAGARLRIAGFHITAQGATNFSSGICPLVVHDTHGVVELADLELNAVGFPLLAAGTEVGALTLRDAAQVVIDGLRAQAGLAPISTVPDAAPFLNGMHGLLAERSNVWINDSISFAMGGSAALSLQGGSPGPGGHGVLAIDSKLQLARVHARGGQAGGFGVAGALPGGAGLDARGSVVRAHGGSQSRFEGANASIVTQVFVSNFGAAGPGARLDATSVLTRAPDVELTPGAALGPLPAGQPLVAAPGATSLVLAERQPALVIAPRYPAVGGPVTVTFEGEPGSVHLRGVAIASAPAFALPGISGAVLLDLGSLLLAPAVVVGAGGATQKPDAVPNFAGFAGIAFVEQSAQVTGLGISLAPPVVLTVGF